MSDSSNGGNESDGAPPSGATPPPARPSRYAGDQAHVPAGFSAGPAAGPPPASQGGAAVPPPPPGIYSGPQGGGFGQVPMPGVRVGGTSKPHRNPIPVVLGLVAIIAVVGAALWFLVLRDDGEDDAVKEGSPGAAVLDWWDAMAERDYAAACDLMATPGIERLTARGGTCREALAGTNPDGLYDQGDQTEVLATKIEKNKARVTIKAGGSPLPKQDMLVIREQGAWLVDPFGDATDLSPRADDPPAEKQPTGPTTTLPNIEMEPGGPAEVYLAWMRALLKNDYDGACSRLTRGTLDELAAKDANCEDTMAGAAELARESDGVPGDSVTVRIVGEAIDGGRAEVSYQLGTEPPEPEPVVLVREDGTWKLDLFASSIGDGSVAGAQAAACRAEQRVVETAVEAYVNENGYPPADVGALLGRFLRDEPENMQIGADGTVTPIGDCA